jgi:hypothetical protein
MWRAHHRRLSFRRSAAHFRFVLTTAAINDKSIYHFSMVNRQWSFGRCTPLACSVLIEALRILASSRFSATQALRRNAADARPPPRPAGLLVLRLAICYAGRHMIGKPENRQQNVKLFLRGPLAAICRL